jgi:SAM-dependent methyltransferase
MTNSVLIGMKDFVNSCEQRLGNLKGLKVLDIGCNDGSLLNFFREKGCETYGVEPTDAALDCQHSVLQEYFDENSARLIAEKFGYPDIITFTNVFAHIENLKDMIKNLQILIGKNTNVVIENHYLGAVLDFSQFDTFYHEHPRTYSLKSFSFIAKSLGLNLVDFQFVSRYGGNIRVFMGAHDAIDFLPINESRFLGMFGKLNIEILNWKRRAKEEITLLNKIHGPLPAKAFPGRAAILIKMLALDITNISAVYEITGSIKVNHFVPSTNIPILPEKDLYDLKDQPSVILNLAWHLPKEVRKNLEKNGYKGLVIDIKEFKFLT